MSLSTAHTIPGYRIEKVLGQGCNGIVYQALQVNLNRPVALKIISQKLCENENFVKQFLREAQTAAQFSHPNLIQAYDVGPTEEGSYYFCMELATGGDLDERLKEEGELEVLQALKMTIKVAKGLEYGQRNRDLTHGDIKPANILLSATGEVKLADLGLARMSGLSQQAAEDIELTPHYAAPEIIKGNWQVGDCRADIYSYGATLYHLIAGEPPFKGKDFQKVLDQHLHDTATPLSEIFEGCPPTLDKFMKLLLEKDLEKRPQNWQAVIERQQKIIDRIESGTIHRKASSKTQKKKIATQKPRVSKKLVATTEPKDKGIPQAKAKNKNLTIIAVTLGIALAAVLPFIIPSKPRSTNTAPIIKNGEFTTENRQISLQFIAGEKQQQWEIPRGGIPGQYRIHLRYDCAQDMTLQLNWNGQSYPIKLKGSQKKYASPDFIALPLPNGHKTLKLGTKQLSEGELTVHSFTLRKFR